MNPCADPGMERLQYTDGALLLGADLASGVGGEARNQIDVTLTYYVLGDARGPQIQRGLIEVFQQILEPAVAILGAAEIGFRIEVDIAEYARQLGKKPSQLTATERAWVREHF